MPHDGGWSEVGQTDRRDPGLNKFLSNNFLYFWYFDILKEKSFRLFLQNFWRSKQSLSNYFDFKFWRWESPYLNSKRILGRKIWLWTRWPMLLWRFFLLSFFVQCYWFDHPLHSQAEDQNKNVDRKDSFLMPAINFARRLSMKITGSRGENVIMHKKRFHYNI